MWGKNVVYVVVRPERYSHEILEESELFSLSAFDEKYKKQLGICGSISGRDSDKLAACGFTLAHSDGAPYIEQARLVISCKKLFASDFTEEQFLSNKDIVEKWYGGGFHTLYIAEIQSIIKEEN